MQEKNIVIKRNKTKKEKNKKQITKNMRTNEQAQACLTRK